MASESPLVPDAFSTFGTFLQFLRRRVRKNLRELAQAVGYSEAHLSRIERGERRPPDSSILLSWFIPALELEDAPELRERLLHLAEIERTEILAGSSATDSVKLSREQLISPNNLHMHPARLEPPEGTMAVDSPFYSERPADPIALAAIQRQGVTLTLKGPRQVGKSSLLVRMKHTAEQAGKQVVSLDFQQVDRAILTDADQFFRFFCVVVGDELSLEDRVDQHWRRTLGNVQCCTRYFERYLLKEAGGRIVLAMDELDALFGSSFRSDFFGMLRSWHNARSDTLVWRQLDLALVTSTEPYQLIENINISPFNVSETIELEDFTPKQVADLNNRHGRPLNADQEQHLHDLLGGHPYLTRKALYLVANGNLRGTELFERATHEPGPFADHLRNHLTRLHERSDLIPAVLQIIHSETLLNEQILFRLQSAGLIRRIGAAVHLRCRLYTEYFREHLPK